MRRARGFTLVELLVVIAIISILAAIVVPNVTRWIERARMAKALSEVKGIELAITKMLADADRSSLNDLLVPDAVGLAVNATPGNTWTTDQFKTAITVYTRATYALLREGRGALSLGEFNYSDGTSTRNLFNTAAVQKLGTSYLDAGFDPWGNMYQIFPGPWVTRNGPNIFRIYQPGQQNTTLPGKSANPDHLTLGNDDGTGNVPVPVKDPATEQDIVIGYPAPRDKVAFIWSTGANLISGQALYSPSPVIPPTGDWYTPSLANYDQSQDQDLLGGGDDINNWDSTSSWGKFYN